MVRGFSSGSLPAACRSPRTGPASERLPDVSLLCSQRVVGGSGARLGPLRPRVGRVSSETPQCQVTPETDTSSIYRDPTSTRWRLGHQTSADGHELPERQLSRIRDVATERIEGDCVRLRAAATAGVQAV